MPGRDRATHSAAIKLHATRARVRGFGRGIRLPRTTAVYRLKPNTAAMSYGLAVRRAPGLRIEIVSARARRAMPAVRRKWSA